MMKAILCAVLLRLSVASASGGSQCVPSLSEAASSAHSLTSKVAAGDPALVAMLEEDATPYSVSLPDNTVVPHDDCVCTLCNSILAAGLEVVSSSFCGGNPEVKCVAKVSALEENCRQVTTMNCCGLKHNSLFQTNGAQHASSLNWARFLIQPNCSAMVLAGTPADCSLHNAIRPCKHGSSLNVATCHCDECPYPWTGQTCNECKHTQGDCKHAGVLNPNTCKCEHCAMGYGGDFCDVCDVSKTCAHGGIIDQQTCSCVNCSAPYVQFGNDFDCRCKALPCSNDGTWNTDACRCIGCAEGWGGRQCSRCETSPFTCEHGQFSTNNCSCTCDVGWTGKNCDKCNLQGCANGGTVQSSECKCQCRENFEGDLCDACKLNSSACLHGGSMNKKTCTCEDCSGSWMGTRCQTCFKTAADCTHGAVFNNRLCKCVGGLVPFEDDGNCTLQQSDCKNGGVLDKGNCTCSLNCPIEYEGRLCEACKHTKHTCGTITSDCKCQQCKLTPAHCKHGSKFDGDHCLCRGCDDYWGGPDCNICTLTHADCAHSPYNTSIDSDCSCASCMGSWTGSTCEMCPLKSDDCPKNTEFKAILCICQGTYIPEPETCLLTTDDCMNGGIANVSSCTCDCPAPFSGDSCERCDAAKPGICKNAGVPKTDICGCDCEYPWDGATCNRCLLKDVSCQANGGNATVDNTTCACKGCPEPYTGRYCDVCGLNTSQCRHGGTKKNSTKSCKCEGCENLWSGVTCRECSMTKKICKNGGSPDTASCSCTGCSAPWSGPDCGTCPFTQSNCKFGVLDRTTCVCNDCPHPWIGGLCNECKLVDSDCAHGTVLSLSECQCSASNASCPDLWSGSTCDTCTNVTCHHGAKFVEELCACDQCPYPWGGKTCNTCRHHACPSTATLNTTTCVCEGPHIVQDECTLVADGEKCISVNEATCKCLCKFPFAVNLQTGDCTGTCAITPVDCKHGIFDAIACACPNGFDPPAVKCVNGGQLYDGKCDCDASAYWGGKTCAKCMLGADSCGNGGLLDEKTCTCACASPWGSTNSYSCNQCKLADTNCTNSVVDPDRCTCKCSLPWGGKECDTCALTDSQCAHGTVDTSTCMCKCAHGWGGKYCDECIKDGSFCFNGATMNTASCACQSCPDPWMGEVCSICKYSKPEHNDPCVNGQIDLTTCKCVSDEGWGGNKSDTCIRTAADSCLSRGVINATICECEKCEYPWNGPACTDCMMAQSDCKRGSKIVKSKCQCVATNTDECPKPWGGPKCGTCLLKKNNCSGSAVDMGACKCACNKFKEGEDCSNCSLKSNDCRRGVAMWPCTGTCNCSTVFPYTGALCDECGLTLADCKNGAVPDFDTCTCHACPTPFGGPQCDQCARTCKNGATQNPQTCLCENCPIKNANFSSTCEDGPCTLKAAHCKHAAHMDLSICQCVNCSAPWSGERCQVCNLDASYCPVGATFDAMSCSCKNCPNGFSGDTCDTCLRNASFCASGHYFSKRTCLCECSPPWTGDQCKLCPIEAASCAHTDNNTVFDKRLCKCTHCPAPWTGARCDTCTNNCQHGGSPDSNCTRCQFCDGTWGGSTCSQCQLKASNCINGGFPNMVQCTCDCILGWSGQDCGTCLLNAEKCASLDAAFDETKCTCKCKAPWRGEKCKTCALEEKDCVHGSKLDTIACRCHADGVDECPLPYKGRMCEMCDLKAIDCKNNGTANKELCKCSCAAGFKGTLCGQCAGPTTCKRGTGYNKETCQCECTSRWSGRNCNTCALTVEKCQGSDFDQASCTCKSCPGMWSGATCSTCGLSSTDCKNGATLNFTTCKCDIGCKKDTGLAMCEEACSLTMCSNGATLDTANCRCVGAHPWGGPNGTTCTLDKSDCPNGNLNAQECKCTTCSAMTSGPECITCDGSNQTDACKNGGVFNGNTCSCDLCNVPYGGDDCASCGMTVSMCTHSGAATGIDTDACACTYCAPGYGGRFCDECRRDAEITVINVTEKLSCGAGYLDKEMCKCMCPGDWSGDSCNSCSLKDTQCENGGVADPILCRCRCKSGWQGDKCEACARDSSFCGTAGLFSADTCSCSKCNAPYEMNTDGRCSCGLTENSCVNGVRDDTPGRCACNCSKNWQGPNCATCAIFPSDCRGGSILDSLRCKCIKTPSLPSGFPGPAMCKKTEHECKPFGFLDKFMCQCNCTSPFRSGSNCGGCMLTSDMCKHGSVFKESACSCRACPTPWTGTTCEVCSMSQSLCKNNSTLDRENCRCDCPTGSGLGGPYCTQCNRKCANNGTLTTNCTCKCRKGFSGPNCEVCTTVCKHSGVMTAGSCECTNCSAGHRNGKMSSCEVCDLHVDECVHGGRVDNRSCSCVDCDGSWAGQTCDTCAKPDSDCLNGGSVNHESCACQCQAPYFGVSCEKLPVLPCFHGSEWKVETQRCESCSDRWIGDQCNTCGLDAAACQQWSLDSALCECKDGSDEPVVPPCLINATDCKHGSKYDPEACKCNRCAPFTSGILCEQCNLKAIDCANGALLNLSSCKCEINCPFGFDGAKCDTCNTSWDNARCVNKVQETIVDPLSCTCKRCAPGWGGKTCNTCILQSDYCLQGEVDPKTCSCKCQLPWSLMPDGTCGNCSVNTCLNGGFLNVKNCACNCTTELDSTMWGGIRCDECAQTGTSTQLCRNNGTWNKGACKCQCKDNWMGKSCDSCGMQNSACSAVNRTLDKGTCECTCQVSNASCTKFQHLDRLACKCVDNGMCTKVCPIGHELNKDDCTCFETPRPCPKCKPNLKTLPAATQQSTDVEELQEEHVVATQQSS